MMKHKEIKKYMTQLPQENRESVAMYLVWQSKRTKLIELTNRDLQTSFDTKEFKEYLSEFKIFIEINKSLYEELKMNYNDLLNTLNNDIKYCDEQLMLVNKIKKKNDEK